MNGGAPLLGCMLTGKTTISMSGTLLSLSISSCTSYCSLRPGGSLSAFAARLFSSEAMSSPARSEKTWRGTKVQPDRAK